MTTPQKTQYAEPPLDSFRRTDRLARLQRGATWLAPLAILGWLALGHAVEGDRRYSPGPVASAHALWNDRCEVCHATSRPISGDNWLGRLTCRTHAGDENCSQCHQGPPHHGAQKPNEVAACAACHVEHRGPQAYLVRVADEQCTRCHANLEAHARRPPHETVPDQPDRGWSKVTAFDGDLVHHPGFEPVDRGRLKFSHKQHMTEGIYGPEDRAAFLLRDIPKERQARYAPAGTPEQTPVQLRCSACHQLDPGSPAAGDADPPRLPASAARPAGAYLLPIVYEVHCEACHPLTIGHKDYKGAFLRVPHRLALDDVRAYLQGVFAPGYLKEQAELKENEQPRPLPGRPSRIGDQLRSLEEAIQAPVALAEQELYGTRKGCVLCHDLAPDPQANNPAGGPAARRIMPTQVPAIWLSKASFNHSTHRLLECRSCHPRADAYTTGAHEALNPEVSEQSGDVLLPKIDTCFACHSSARRPGARSDCVECHRYHNGDSPLEGKGAVTREPLHPLSLEEFRAGAIREAR